jgi:activator of HSP90 ATPase
MPKTIVQKVMFKNTTPKTLYNLYMNEKQHSMITGGPAKISEKVGSAFSSHGKYITGKNLHLVKDKQITQTWRAKNWSKKETDSIFTINLEQKGKDVVLHAVHTNLPDKAAAGVNKGWHSHYWNPWKQHLAGKTITRPKM